MRKDSNTSPPIWTPSQKFLAQSAHVGWGWALALTTPMLLVDRLADDRWLCLLLTWVLWYGIDVFKETVLDPRIEQQPFFWSGVVDLAFGGLGGVLGSLAYLFLT